MRRALFALALAALLAGCGSDSKPAAAPPPPTTTTRAADRPPLAPGWHRTINRRGGFSFGLPPGWSARQTDALTRVRSRDRGLVMTVTSDTGGGLAADPRAYAKATLRALTGYAGLLLGHSHHLIDTPYPGSTATASGRLRATGVDQQIVAVAMRPPGLNVTFALLAFFSAARRTSVYDPAINAIVATFRRECCKR